MPKREGKPVSMKSKDLMVVPPITIAADATIDEAAELMWEKNVGSLMAVDKEGKMVGIFTERDVLFSATKSMIGQGVPVSSIMSRTALTASPNESIVTAIEKLRQAGVRHLPVADKNGKPLGMISVRDVLDVSGPVMKLVLRAAGKKRTRR